MVEHPHIPTVEGRSRLDMHIEHLEGEYAPPFRYEEDVPSTMSAPAPSNQVKDDPQTTADWTAGQSPTGPPAEEGFSDVDFLLMFEGSMDVDVNSPEYLNTFCQSMIDAPQQSGLQFEAELQQMIEDLLGAGATLDPNVPHLLDPVDNSATSADEPRQQAVNTSGGQAWPHNQTRDHERGPY